MDILCKKTVELTVSEKEQICKLFEDVFSKVMTIASFDAKFLKNEIGTSYHSFLLDEASQIVGCYSVIPFSYDFFGKKTVFGLSVDTMIAESHRGSPMTLKRLGKKVYEQLTNDGLSFVFGFPNDNVYLIRKKILKWQDIGNLDFYALPMNTSIVSCKLAFLTPIYRFFCQSLFFLDRLLLSSMPRFSIALGKTKPFLDYRFDETYQRVILKSGGSAYYKAYEEEGIKALYLVDVYPLSRKNLSEATRKVFLKEKGNADIILYVGKPGFLPTSLIKVPFSKQPKEIHMSGLILDDNIVDERIFDIANWDVNLSNFDVR